MTREEYVDWCTHARISIEGLEDSDYDHVKVDYEKLNEIQLASEYRWLDHLLNK